MQLFLAFASLIAAVVPMFFYLLLIWWMDRNERDPFWIVFLNFFWGATGAIFLGIIGSVLFQLPLNVSIQTFFGSDAGELVNLSGAVITAPLVEEFTKGVFLFIMVNTRKFDGVVDGVVYGGAIGLGFGMTENFIYFLTNSSEPVSWFMIVVLRTLFSAVMHCMATATFGGFLGLAKFKPAGLKIILLPAGFFIAVFLHFSWNLTVSFEETTLLGFAFLVFYFIGWFSVFQIALFLEARTIKRELEDESVKGLIPSEHLYYLPYITRRFKFGWCPQGVNQKQYVKTAVQLALSKYHFKNSSGKRQIEYQREIENYRYNIQMMFYNANLSYNKSRN